MSRENPTTESSYGRTDPQPRLIADGGDQLVDACPECDRAELRERAPGSPNSPLEATAPQYKCNLCGAETDDPVTRPAKQGRHGAAKTLADADPDDLVTDGGEDVVEACPECDTVEFFVKSGRNLRESLDKGRYFCKSGHHFDEPVERPRRGSSHQRGSEHTQALIDADPDDLVTDGGTPTPALTIDYDPPMQPRRRIEFEPASGAYNISESWWGGCNWRRYSHFHIQHVEMTLAVGDAQVRIEPLPDGHPHAPHHDVEDENRHELTAADHVRQALAHLAAASEVPTQ